jgi:hypothetical protein
MRCGVLGGDCGVRYNWGQIKKSPTRMKKPRQPKHAAQFKVPEKSVPANLPSVEWLKELQDTLKKQSEAAIALIKLTTSAAQRIAAYSHSAALATHLFSEEELRSGLVDYRRAVMLITGHKKRNLAETAFREAVTYEECRYEMGLEVWEIQGFDEEHYEGELREKMTTKAVLWWLESFQDYVRTMPKKGKQRAKKYFDSIAGQSPPKPSKKPGRKRQYAARGRRNSPTSPSA